MKKLLFSAISLIYIISCSKDDNPENPILGKFQLTAFYGNESERYVSPCYGRTLFSFTQKNVGLQDIYWETETECEKLVTGTIEWEQMGDEYLITSSSGLLFGDANQTKEGTASISNNILKLKVNQSGEVFDLEFKRIK